MSNLTTNERFRFGVFEVDLERRELRKRGIRIKLQDKPFDVLEALLEKPGEFVGREQLVDRLWGAEPLATANRNLNRAITRLRVALGDSHENPRYVETRPRLGYRFVAPVEGIESRPEVPPVPVTDLATPPSEAPAASAFPTPVSVTEVETPPASAEPELSPQRTHSVLAHSLIGVGVAIAILVMILFVLFRPAEPLSAGGSRQLTNDGRQKVGRLCTDGRYVYFSQFWNGRVMLAHVPTAGGETRLLETPFDVTASVFALDVSRDGQELLVKTGKGVIPEANADPLWILSPTNGAARRVFDLRVNDARWSPDGKQLAYFAGDQLYIAHADATSPREVIRKPGINADISWHPGGKHLRFRSGLPGRYHSSIWEVRTDGTGLRKVFTTWEYEQQHGDWTDDAKHYVFYSPTDFKLWSSAEGWRPFGSAVPTLLNTGPMRFQSPRLGPDGRTLYTIGEILRGELMQWDSNTSQFLPYRPGLSADQLDFTGKGDWVTYVSFPENVLWRSRADGSNRLQLTYPPMQVYLPRYSPDGTQIIFMGRLPEARWRMYVVPSDGGTPQPVLAGEGTEADPNWSPDGKKIVFAPFPWEVGREDSGVRVFDFETRKVTRIAGGQEMFSPRWSPDGKRIFALHADGEGRLFDFDSGKWTAFPMQGGFPAWSHDGRFVYVFHAFTDERGIYRFEIPTHRIEKVASLQGIDVAGILGPHGLSLGPGNSPIILRDLSVQEIYAFDLQ